MPTDEEPTLTQTIKQEFEAIPFTQTSGNSHYASRDAEDLKRRNASVEAFLRDSNIEEPDIYPTKYDSGVIDDTIAKYEALLDILISQPKRSEEDEILIDRLIAKSGELFRYEELMHAVGSLAIDGFSRHRRIAGELSLEFIGGINQDSFDMLLGELTDLAEKSSQPYGKELLELVGSRPKPEGEVSKAELLDKTYEVLKQDLVNLYPGLNELLLEADTGPLSPEDAVPIFERLQEIADLDGEWRVRLTEGKAAETSGAKKEVTIGRNRSAFKSRRDAIAVGFHESVVHAGRSEGISLPGSLDFEEGLATRLQQIISGEHRTPGEQYYLSIGLQAGSDRDGVVRNYRQTFEILWRREALLMEQAGKEVDVKQAQVRAQRQIQRTRRGGAIDTRDAAYFLGAQKAARWLNSLVDIPVTERRHMLSLALTNRYDPTDPEQVAYIKRHA